MILNLLNTMLITLGTGASVLTIPKKPTPPINRATQNFSIRINRNGVGETLTEQNYNKQNAYEYKLSGNNTALLIKGNEITYNKYTVSQNEVNITIATENYNNATFTPRMVTIYQITTYENTQNVENYYEIYTLFSTASEFWGNSTTDIEKIMYKTTTYQTQENWSQYIDRNDYLTWNYDNTLEDEITDPTNGYRYSVNTTITNATDSGNDNYAWITTPLTLTKSTTTYVIQIIQPIVKINQPNETITLVQPSEVSAKYFIYRTDNLSYAEINGTMIIPEGTTEIVDIPGLMFQVLTMPFTFISAAFNLTLFPGTPYQINISNLFMAIIAVMAFIFILKLLIGLKGGN